MRKAHKKRSIHLICNAHLDPVWQWEWEEGAAAAISTFRTAADLCEEYPGLIFNHNEAILYQWIEDYEPSLFQRIQKLVQEKKWQIMGGWYLQPDCNMPCGESFVRQILLGRRYFHEKFGVMPTTAINFDSFGHTRGLVQILAKSGYNSYLFWRPFPEDCVLEKEEFIWEGYDGSQVLATRAYGGYSSAYGWARLKTEAFMKQRPDIVCGVLLWGIGNHGGGPSRVDLENLNQLTRETEVLDIRHSTPEAYFEELKQQDLPVHKKDLNPWGVGCYTSGVKIKQTHRRLENEFYAAEKMIASAWCQGLMAYPQEQLKEALKDLATSQFHDILPGESIQEVIESSLQLMDHGLEILSRLKAKAFFTLTQGQTPAREKEIPILVYNPHPLAIETDVVCEFQLADMNLSGTFTQVTAYQEGKPLPTQVEKESSNIPFDWRKRVVFNAKLAPSQMNRFDFRLEAIPQKPKPELKVKDNRIVVKTTDMEVIINAATGLIDRYRVRGVDCLSKGACHPLVMFDSEDPWGMNVKRFRDTAGAFALLSEKDSARFSGVTGETLPAVRVIEDGPVRAVVEAVFGYSDSYICQRYRLPKQGTEIELELHVLWNEKDRMLKLSLPTPFKEAEYFGQVAYGRDTLRSNGDEVIAQKWVAVISKQHDLALSVINDGIYGSDCEKGEMRLSLLRSPAYAAHPVGDLPILPRDRYTPRMDQGENLFHFWINAGPVEERFDTVEAEALARNEKPMALSFFPSGAGLLPKAFITLSDTRVQVATIKPAEEGNGLVLRLFEPTGRKRTTSIRLPFAKMEKEITLKPFEIRTYRVDIRKRTWTAVDLLERPVADE